VGKGIRQNEPPTGHPLTIEYYILTLLHQFAFWEISPEYGYTPWFGIHRGVSLRGSDFVWSAMRNLLRTQPILFYLNPPCSVDPVECSALVDDNQQTPPRWDQHLALSSAIRRYFSDVSLESMVEGVRSSPTYKNFLCTFADMPGYMEDPLRKRLHLFYQCMERREDDLLGMKDCKAIAPAIDYHIQRLLLRIGVIRVSPSIRSVLVLRRPVESVLEEELRGICDLAVRQLIHTTDLSSSSVDDVLFSAARKCSDHPSGPNCKACPMEQICEKDTELFQPLVVERVWY